MREIKLSEKEMMEVKEGIKNTIDELDLNDSVGFYGIYVELKRDTLFFPIGIEENEGFVSGFEVGVYDREDCDTNGFYAEEIGMLNEDQEKELLDLVEELLKEKNDSVNTIHTDEDEITEYDEFLLGLKDGSDYFKALKELANSGITGLPLVSLINEVRVVCDDLEQIAMSVEE